MHATLRVILNAAVDDGLIVENPTDKLGRALKLVAKTRVRQEHVKAFDRAQRDTFLTTAAKIEPWWAPMWDVQALSGSDPVKSTPSKRPVSTSTPAPRASSARSPTMGSRWTRRRATGAGRSNCQRAPSKCSGRTSRPARR
jgi:hypothetical protein